MLAVISLKLEVSEVIFVCLLVLIKRSGEHDIKAQLASYRIESENSVYDKPIVVNLQPLPLHHK